MSLRVKDGNTEIEILFDHISCAEVNKRFLDLYGTRCINLPVGKRCTLATIKFNGEPKITGCAACSKNDNFCKSTGRKIALQRAIWAAKRNGNIDGLRMDKSLSTKIWDTYRKNCK